MSNDLAVKTSQLTNAVKQMSDYLNGKIDNNTTQLNDIASEVGESYKTEDTRIIAPQDLYFVTGYDYTIFRKNFLMQETTKNDFIKCEIITPKFLSRSNDELRIKAQDAQIFDTKISTYNTLKTTQIAKDVRLHFADKPSTRQTINVMNIGDSIQTHNMSALTKTWLDRMNVTANMLGTTDNTNVHGQTGYDLVPTPANEMNEGRGGWRFTDFLNITKKADGSHFDMMYSDKYKPMWDNTGVFNFGYYIRNYLNENIYDSSKSTDGKLVRESGTTTIQPQDGYATSDYIPVEKGDKLLFNSNWYGLEEYKEDKAAVTNYKGLGNNSSPFYEITNENTKFIRVTINKSKASINKNAVYPDFITIALGTNDIGKGHYSGNANALKNPTIWDLLEDKSGETYIPNMLKTMIDSILAFKNDIKIAIQPPLTCGATDSNMNRFFKTLAELEIDLAKTYTNGNVFVLGTYMGQSMYSSDWMQNTTKTPISEINDTYKVSEENVHKNLASQQNSALWYASWIVNNLQ